MAKRTISLVRVTLTWRDATMHGHQQYHPAEFKDGTEPQLTPGIAIGWLVHETDEAITIAMDWFGVSTRGEATNDWRVVASYPKSGIRSVKRERVRVVHP